MKKRNLTLGIVLALLAAMVAPMAALAGNQAGQSAGAFSTALNIVDKVGDTAVTNIIFSPGAPGTTVSDPLNTVNGGTDKQVLSASASEPVVRLNNTSGAALIVSLQISPWTNGVVVSEDYELVAITDTTVAVVDNVLSATGGAATVNTTVSIANGAYLALYLEVVLIGSTGVTGTSQLTILGETP